MASRGQPRPSSASLGQSAAFAALAGPNSFRRVSGAGFGDDGFEESRVGKRERARWGLVYEDGVAPSEVGTPVHALELAHAAKFNLGTSWGVGDSCVPGPDPHRRTGQLAGSGYVAVAGPHAVRSKCVVSECEPCSLCGVGVDARLYLLSTCLVLA